LAISSERSLCGLPGFPQWVMQVVKERVNASALPTVEDIRRDSDLFLEGTRTNEIPATDAGCDERGASRPEMRK
jgi:hypothetical protein